MSTLWLCLLLTYVVTLTTGHPNWECPLPGDIPVAICEEECGVDTDCENNERCCYNGCGHVCMRKVPGHGGSIDCSNQLCYLPTCHNEIKYPPGRCCPVCPGQP